MHVIHRLTNPSQFLPWWSLGLLPLAGIVFLRLIVPQDWQLKAYIFHESSILFAVGLTALITVVTYRSFRRSPDSYLQSVLLALLSFIVVFLPHALLTQLSGQNLILFLVFGPLSRAIVSIYLFFGLLKQKHSDRLDEHRQTQPVFRQCLPHLIFFIACDGLIFVLAGHLHWLTITHLRILEITALAFWGLSLLLLLHDSYRPLNWHLKLMFFLFIQVSIAFLLARPWNCLWWFAHGVSLAGFLILGYAMAQYSQLSVYQKYRLN